MGYILKTTVLNILLSNYLVGSGNGQLLPWVNSDTHPNGTCRGFKAVSSMVRQRDEKIPRQEA